jgi:16S rRNA G1207 methylase RsmC
MKDKVLPTTSDFQHNGCCHSLVANFKGIACDKPIEPPTSYLIIPAEMDFNKNEVIEAIKEIRKERGQNQRIIVVGSNHAIVEEVFKLYEDLKNEDAILATRGCGKHHSAEKLANQMLKFSATCNEASRSIKILSNHIDNLGKVAVISKPEHPFQKFIGKKKY